MFALSSGQPPAGIAVIRISGPAAGNALRSLAGSVGRPRYARYAALHNGDILLDRALTLWFPAPASATGEDVAELHLHGGRAVIAAVLDALQKMPTLRPALPGEFTRRAFTNQRIDLAEAEGLADLLEAETETQRRNAMALADGAFGRLANDWRFEVLALSARVEASLDFGDEDDVVLDTHLHHDLAQLAGRIAQRLSLPGVERLREGIRVVIAGPPNAGKSTLLNAIVGREAAIATPIAGTTRDLIEVPVAIGGVPFAVTDTAGLREHGDAIEEIGIARARAALDACDILLWLGAPSEAPATPHRIVIAAQSDRYVPSADADIAVSAKTGAGMDALLSRLITTAQALLPAEGQVAFNRRQRAALSHVRQALADAVGVEDDLLVAEQLRRARAALDHATGNSGVEDMLDVLFGRFCIGK